MSGSDFGIGSLANSLLFCVIARKKNNIVDNSSKYENGKSIYGTMNSTPDKISESQKVAI